MRVRGAGAGGASHSNSRWGARVSTAKLALCVAALLPALAAAAADSDVDVPSVRALLDSARRRTPDAPQPDGPPPDAPPTAQPDVPPEPEAPQPVAPQADGPPQPNVPPPADVPPPSPPDSPSPSPPGQPDTDPFAKDAYNTLHVSPDADVDAIKTAYHGVADGLATAHDGKSEEKLAELTEAYQEVGRYRACHSFPHGLLILFDCTGVPVYPHTLAAPTSLAWPHAP